MVDLTKLRNKTTLDKIRNYSGSNEYILKMKRRLDSEGFFVLTTSQTDYVQENIDREPIEINKVVEISVYLAEQLKEKYELKNIPERIFVDSILSESDKSYHVKGKLYKNQKDNILFYLPKTQIITDMFEESLDDIIIDFDTYKEIDSKNRTPFKHQEVGIKFLVKKNKAILADDMGLGKTYMSIVAALEVKAEKILVICPANAKINWKREISTFVDEDDISIIKSGHWNPKKFTIINYDILNKFHTIIDGRKKYEDHEIKRFLVDEGFDLIIMDECFTYNTIVKTELGDMPIGKIVENNIDVKILSFNLETQKLEYKKINRWIGKTTTNSLLKIKLPNGVFIECTPNHKIYVKNKGYVKAEEIKEGDELYYLSEDVNKKTNMEERKVLFKNMCSIKSRNKKNNDRKNQEIISREKKKYDLRNLWKRTENSKQFKTKILFNKLLSNLANVTRWYKRKNNKNTTESETFRDYKANSQKKSSFSKTFFRKNEKIQSYVHKRSKRKNEKILKRPNFFKSWGEWKNNQTTGEDIRIVKRRKDGLGFGISYKNENGEKTLSIITESLFSRYCKSIFKGGYRNRWRNSQNKKVEIFRQKENGSLKFFRVEGIEILERRGGQKPNYGGGNNTKVYNLEIDENHNYFANGILVSNCHFIKNPKAQRSKVVMEVAENIKRRWLLSGTPVANRPMDYYNLLKLCDSSVTANWQFYAFRYCAAKKFKRKGSNRFIWITDGASNLDELHKRTKNLILRRKKEDHLDLPPKIVSPYYIEIDDMNQYNRVFDEYLEWAKSEGRNLGAGRHMVELVVLRKYLAQEKVKHSIELAEQAIENGQKVIIFTNFTDSFNLLMDHFGKLSVGHNGKMNEKQKQNSIDQFQENPKIKVFVGNLISAGSAITLTAAQMVIMNDLDFVPANHAQAEDRAWRIGTTSTVNIYYPIVDGTLDVQIFNILQKKKDIINTVMGETTESLDISEDIIGELIKIGSIKTLKM